MYVIILMHSPPMLLIIVFIQLLVLMWNQCCSGDFTLVTNALAREYNRHMVVSQCQGIDQSGDDTMDSDSEGGEEEEEDGGEEGGVVMSGTLNEAIVEMEEVVMETGANVSTVAPAFPQSAATVDSSLVEDSSWESVQRGKGKTKGKGKK